MPLKRFLLRILIENQFWFVYTMLGGICFFLAICKFFSLNALYLKYYKELFTNKMC